MLGSTKGWHEECGVFGAIGVPRAAEIVSLGLHALQHRGQESAGLVCCDERGEFHSHKGLGLVSDVFRQADLTRADLRRAGLDGVDLTAANLRETRIDLQTAVMLAEMHGAVVDLGE